MTSINVPVLFITPHRLVVVSLAIASGLTTTDVLDVIGVRLDYVQEHLVKRSLSSHGVRHINVHAACTIRPRFRTTLPSEIHTAIKVLLAKQIELLERRE